MRTILLNGGDMGGTTVETSAATGDLVEVTSDTGGTAGQVLLYRVEADGRGTFVGMKG